MISPALALSLQLQLAGFAPELPPDVPAATDATQSTAPSTVPPTEPTPAPAAGSVAIILVSTPDPQLLATTIAARLAPLGISPSFATSSDFSLRLGPAPEDRIAEIWVLVSTTELRVVITDPAHAHTLVRTLPITEPLEPTSLADAAAGFIEDGVTTAVSSTWPASVPLPPVVVEPPLSSTSPIEPTTAETKPSRPARGNHPRGILLGVTGGIAWVRDELHNVALGVPALVRFGYLFGHNRRFPDLRASLEGRVGSTTVPHSATDLTLVQAIAESRIGFTRGPVWMFGMVGIGSGMYYRHRGGESFRDSAGLMGTLGVGVSVRLSRYVAIHCDGVASGHPDLVGRLGFDLGVTGYLDLSKKGRGR